MTKNRLLRITPALGAVAATLALTGCGGGNSATPVTTGEDESVNVQAGHLVYQVQLSRTLNPHAVDDSQYLQGIDPAELRTGGADELFSVWVRAQNTTSTPYQSTGDFAMIDAAGNEYDPLPVTGTNPFKYEPQLIEQTSGNGQPTYPDPSSANGTGPIRGSMLLFRVPVTIYQNEPVELRIVPEEGGEPSTVSLDL
ncbi:MAG TPA: hypothetical protein VGM91_16605 [Conexibacter sp.]|jgi:hypothetical protein